MPRHIERERGCVIHYFRRARVPLDSVDAATGGHAQQRDSTKYMGASFVRGMCVLLFCFLLMAVNVGLCFDERVRRKYCLEKYCFEGKAWTESLN